MIVRYSISHQVKGSEANGENQATTFDPARQN